jgi:hypothetical protein
MGLTFSVRYDQTLNDFDEAGGCEQLHSQPVARITIERLVFDRVTADAYHRQPGPAVLRRGSQLEAIQSDTKVDIRDQQ